MGYIVYGATERRGERTWTVSALYLFAANAPDLDFLPGLVVGDLSRFHHGPSHSVGFAILFGIVASLFWSHRLCTFVVASSLYFSHVVLDYLVQDASPASVAVVLRISHGAVRLFSQIRLPGRTDRPNGGSHF